MIAHQLVDLMFEDPRQFRSEVEKLVSKNRKLSSKTRRELKDFAFGAFRWKRRLWDQKPSNIDVDDIRKKIEDFQKEEFNDALRSLQKIISVEEQAKRLSYPTWMFQRWVEDHGFDQAVNIAWVQNQSPSLCLRVNTLVTTRKLVEDYFKKENREVRMGSVPGSIYTLARENIRGLVGFKKGFFEIQDEHSQQVCVWAEPKLGQMIIDGCSRTGGKALHLAALTENKAKILCMDVDARVFEELGRRAKRLNAKQIITQWIAKDDPNPRPDLKEKAELVFVDAPCSGSGALRHNPGSRWDLDPSDLEGYQAKQVEILKRQCRWVKPGGRLIYVTCSIFKDENDRVVEKFLKELGEFSEVRREQLFPKHLGGDGFFYSMMLRT